MLLLGRGAPAPWVTYRAVSASAYCWRALAVRAPVLIMDEPLANLDPPHQSDWLRILRGHVLGGGTAIAVLHEITMALHADDLVVMNAGQIVHQGDCAHSATHRALEQVFDNRVAVRHVADRWVALLQSGWAKGQTTP